MGFAKGLKRTFGRTDIKAMAYGMLSNWGIVVLANIVGSLFINIIGIDLVRIFTPALYLLLGLGFYFPSPKSRDFRIGYVFAFLVGLVLLTIFYYPLLNS